MKNKYSAKQVKMATGIAKQKHDSMTDAVERIEKIAKGLSDHPGVSRAIKRYNEETNMYYHEEFGYGEVLESSDEQDTVLFPHGVEIIEKSCGSKKEDNTNDTSDDGEGLDKVQPKALKKKFKDRKDKDIDNDGDEDESDEYLHNRRKTVSKAIAKEEVEQIDEAVSTKDKARLIGALGGWAYARANKDATMARDHNAEFWVTLQKVAPKVGGQHKEKDLSKQSWANTDSISALKKGLGKFLGESVEDWEIEEMNENFTTDDIAEQDARVNETIERAKAFIGRMWENSAAGANAKRTANAVEAEPQLTVHDKNSVTGKSKKYHDDNTVDRKDDEERSHDDAVKASKAVKTQAASRNGTDNLR